MKINLNNVLKRCISMKEELQEGDFNYYDNRDGTATITRYTGDALDVIIPVAMNGELLTVAAIADSAFEGKQLTSVILPSMVKKIGDYAFYNNRLTSVIIPYSVARIGSNAFNTNELTHVIIEGRLTKLGWDAFAFNFALQIIYGVPNSAAHQYAKEKRIRFDDVKNNS